MNHLHGRGRPLARARLTAVVYLFAILAILPGLSSRASGAEDEHLMLGYGEIKDPAEASIIRWITLVATHRAQLGLGSEPLPVEGGNEELRLRWQRSLEALRDGSADTLLQRVNKFVNRTSYRRDDERFGIADRWATPLEFLAQGGDCEDFAATKFLLLQALGVRAEDMRVVVLERSGEAEAHSVLAVRRDGSWTFLDNADNRLIEEPALSGRPIYSVSNAGSYRYLMAGGDISSVLALTSAGASRPSPRPER